MGVYIKGMEMPTEEYGSMTITIYPNGSVMEYIGDIGRSLGYAVPVPLHGDLVDKQYAYQNTMAIGEHTRKIILKQIDALPTIIPAEEAPAEDINVPGTYDLLYEEGGPDTR